MKPPSLDWFVGYGALGAELGGVGVGIARWRKVDAGRQFVVVWLGASAFADIAEFVGAPIWHNVQPIARVWYAASVAFAIAALAAFQHSRSRAAAFHAVIAVYLVGWIVLALTLEPIQRYSTYLGPAQGVVILGAAVITMFRRVAITRRDLLSDPGFIVGVALCVYAIPSAFKTLIAQLWLNGPVDRVIAFYALCSVISAVAAFLIICALLVRGAEPVATSA